MRFKTIVTLVALSVLANAIVVGQGVVRQPVDRIIAVVGNTVIPESALDIRIFVLQQSGAEIPGDPGKLREYRKQLLDEIISDELLVQAARQDTTVFVSEEEITNNVDDEFRRIRDQFPSQLDMERNLQRAGFRNVDDYRQWLTTQTRRSLQVQALREGLRIRGQLTPIPATEDELREAFERLKPTLNERPATVSFRQIVVIPQSDTTALLEAFTRADSIARVLRDGGDFAELAREFSADPGSRNSGGEMGWFRRGEGLVREFEDAAFRLQPGAISGPVRTAFGFHIIEVVRSAPASVQARHILIAPAITEANRQTARDSAESVARQLRNGVRFDALVHYHDQTEERIVKDFPRDNAALPASYRTAFEAANPGDVLGPIELDRGGNKKYGVVVFDGGRETGALTLEDIRDQLRPQLAEENALKRFLSALREATYIDIRL